ncbi:MAG: DUF2971 domain-containing protein [Bacteriovoracaceae bacterium]|nr:DUF2971 domain-containing protein [Bacteriovoracaceae bacterium]
MDLPKKVYKYFSLKTNDEIFRVKNILENQHVYFSKIFEFNDPFEGYSLYPSNSLNTKYDKIQLDFERKKINESYGVCCFTSNLNDIRMWTQYADSCKGICIEFDSEFGILKDLKKVNYVEAFDKFTNKESLLNKHRNWSHEKELRLISEEYIGKCSDVQSVRISGVYYLNVRHEKNDNISEIYTTAMMLGLVVHTNSGLLNNDYTFDFKVDADFSRSK